jgi:ABC-2 type transport system ATP-binding protein
MTETQASAPVLEAQQLTKFYGQFIGVRDVSFRVSGGQIVGLLGPNGAGKTTLMRMLTGFVAPSAGRAVIGGYDVQRDRLEAAALIGYLPENGPLYPDMTPIEVLRFFGEARGLPHSLLAARLEVVAEQCDIRAILDKPVGKLSKGLRQRVGLAQALLHDPSVLIMDEPTAGLDPIQIRVFRSQARKLAENRTLLISTHILQEVEAIADRLLVMSSGRLVFDGKPADLGHGAALEARFFELTKQTSRFTATGGTR